MGHPAVQHQTGLVKDADDQKMGVKFWDPEVFKQQFGQEQ